MWCASSTSAAAIPRIATPLHPHCDRRQSACAARKTRMHAAYAHRRTHPHVDNPCIVVSHDARLPAHAIQTALDRAAWGPTRKAPGGCTSTEAHSQHGGILCACVCVCRRRRVRVPQVSHCWTQLAPQCWQRASVYIAISYTLVEPTRARPDHACFCILPCSHAHCTVQRR